MIKLYILLGGNLGDKKKIFSDTRNKINELIGNISKQSAIYVTEPWGFKSEDLFWNQALEIATAISPEKVLLICQNIENEMGRIRSENQYHSRTIDIDILFYGMQIINTGNLIIPHPRIQERKFALVPLNEIAPGLIHPVSRKNVSQLLCECTDHLRVEKVSGIQ